MTVSDARVSGDSEGDCAGDAPTEISTIGGGGFRASFCLICSSVVEGSTAPEGSTPVSGGTFCRFFSHWRRRSDRTHIR